MLIVLCRDKVDIFERFMQKSVQIILCHVIVVNNLIEHLFLSKITYNDMCDITKTSDKHNSSMLTPNV